MQSWQAALLKLKEYRDRRVNIETQIPRSTAVANFKGENFEFIVWGWTLIKYSIVLSCSISSNYFQIRVSITCKSKNIVKKYLLLRYSIQTSLGWWLLMLSLGPKHLWQASVAVGCKWVHTLFSNQWRRVCLFRNLNSK